MLDRRLTAIQPIRGALLPIPGHRPGICSICAGAIDRRCRQCDDASAVLGLLPPVHPITLAVKGGQIDRILTRYKHELVAVDERHRHQSTLAALVSLFVDRHAACIGSYDTVIGVSSAGRCAPESVIARVGALRPLLNRPLVRVEDKSRSASASAYRLTADVRGRRVLLVDDTFVSGASVYSAVAALRTGGAVIVGVLAFGRHVRPDWPPSRDMLTWLQPLPWHPDRCRICAGATPTGAMF